MGRSFVKHYLITQWNCDIYDLDWLNNRRKIFEKFCLPSVESQKNTDFEWILVSDSRTPDKFKSILEAYPATVIYPDFENYDWEEHAPPCNDLSSIMKRSTQLEYIKQILVNHLSIPLDTDYVITSRCDNDDCIAVDHISRIQRIFYTQFSRPKDERFWLSLVRGMKWCNRKVYPFNSASNPFISFVEIPKNLETCYQVCHTLARNTKYPFYSIRQGSPTWLQVIHGDNLLNKLMRYRGEASDWEIRDRFIFND